MKNPFSYQAHDFARLSGVTVRTLHHYDRLGLLKPTGYTRAGYRVHSRRQFNPLPPSLIWDKALKKTLFTLNCCEFRRRQKFSKKVLAKSRRKAYIPRLA
ncbi:MAG: MerR family DNA-binding transcriptional regulator [Pyrinomonadaceae bacterium]